MARVNAAAAVSEREVRLESVHFLRALDWRFLLPRPAAGPFRHLLLLGSSAEVAEAVVELGIARSVSRDLSAATAADAVILLHGARETLANAVRSLAPGGVLYGEIERPGRWSAATLPWRVQQSLERAGLTRIQLYWCMPGFADHEAYVPLGNSSLMRWYLANLSRLRVWLNPLLAALAQLGERAFGAAIRSYVVTGVAGPVAAAPPSLLAHAELAPELRPRDAQLLVFAPGPRRVVLLPFAAGGAEPLGAMKLSRNPSRNHRAVNEQGVIADIYNRVDDSLRPTLPRPYGCIEWGGMIATVEGGIGGRMLSDRNTGWRRDVHRSIDDLERVVGWLTNFQRQTEIRRVRWGDSDLYRATADLIAEYEAALPVTSAEQALFAELRQRSTMLADMRVPLVRGHGDFHGGNIFRDGDRISVIDWVPAVEPPWSGAEACSLVDLLRFVTDYNAHEHRSWSDRAKVRSLETLFLHPDTSDPLVRAIHQQIARYTAALSVDPRLVPLVLVQMYMAKASLFSTRRVNRELAQLFAAYVRALAADPKRLFGNYDAGSSSAAAPLSAASVAPAGALTGRGE